MIKYAIFGANGGIGSACYQQLQKHNIQVDQFTRQDLNFEDTNAVSTFDLSGYPRPFHSVYGSTKLASSFATNLIAKEAENYKITEVRLGLVATNFRHTNYNGTKTKSEVAEEYKKNNAMDPTYIAEKIILGIQNKQQLINIDH